MKLLKKNQIVIYVIAIMLMTAGYLNYTTKQNNNLVETSLEMESKDDMQLADIGDAQLVSSNDVVKNDSTGTKENNKNGQEEPKKEVNAENLQNEYFIKSKLERDNMFSQMIETYENVLNSNNSLETQKQTATQEISKINKTKNSIMICENLIKTKGFENNVIFVNDKSISAIVEAKDIKKEEIAQIQNIIAREMNASIENIHISTK